MTAKVVQRQEAPGSHLGKGGVTLGKSGMRPNLAKRPRVPPGSAQQLVAARCSGAAQHATIRFEPTPTVNREAETGMGSALLPAGSC